LFSCCRPPPVFLWQFGQNEPNGTFLPVMASAEDLSLRQVMSQCLFTKKTAWRAVQRQYLISQGAQI
jgi:hypothetical protein